CVKLNYKFICKRFENGKEITNLLLSPDGNYAVTWSKDDTSICGWQFKNEHIESSVESPKPFEFDCLIYLKDLKAQKGELRELRAVSNNKLVAIQQYDNKIEVINVETRENYLEQVYSVKECRFYNRDFLIVCQDYTILKFSREELKDRRLKLTNSIHCGASKDIIKCHINAKEKIMLLDSCGSLTQWSLNLLFEKQYQLDIARFENKKKKCRELRDGIAFLIKIRHYLQFI
ncbi:12726_t:CDS:2, partial [Dentiscutata heterogama]